MLEFMDALAEGAVLSFIRESLCESRIDTPKLPFTDYPKWQDHGKHGKPM